MNRKHNPETNTLDEVNTWAHPDNIETIQHLRGTEYYKMRLREYDDHLASLTSIPCAKGTEGLWSAGELTDRNYEVIDGIAWPHPLNGYARGNYFCTCHNCKKQFGGDKRAVTCHDCAYPIEKGKQLLTVDQINKDAIVMGFHSSQREVVKELLNRVPDVDPERVKDAAFYCQTDAEEGEICEEQCDHCKEYYKPLEDQRKAERVKEGKENLMSIAKRIYSSIDTRETDWASWYYGFYEGMEYSKLPSPPEAGEQEELWDQLADMIIDGATNEELSEKFIIIKK